MTQEGWPARFTRAIASQVRLYRRQRGLSAQQLSQKCTDIGLEISRSTIADLENGRRVVLTVAELYVLAVALDLPPIELAVPLGRAPSTEVLPGRLAPVWDVARWFRGDSALHLAAGGSDLAFADPDDSLPIDLFARHQMTVEHWRTMDSMVRLQAAVLAEVRASGRPDLEASVRTMDTFHGNREGAERDLQEVRAIIRTHGLRPPPLPPELAHLESPDGPACGDSGS